MISAYKFYTHKKCSDWGIGRILLITTSFVLIDFPKSGLKKMAPKYAESLLNRVSEEESFHFFQSLGIDVEPESELEARLEKEIMRGKLPVPYDEPPYYDGDGSAPVAGTGRRAPSYLRSHHEKFEKYGAGYFS